MIRFSYLILLFVAASCADSEENKKMELPFEVPSYFPDFVCPDDNVPTSNGIALGKQLFFDKRLSADNSISCGSCHLQRFAFGDNFALSDIGMSKNSLMRNTPPLYNLTWYKGFFRDGGNTSLELQVLGPLTHDDEMGKNPRILISELENDSVYPGMFKVAFGNDSITLRRMAYAIAQYERSLISSNSKYDLWKQGKTKFTESENRGYQLFKSNCSSCHSEPLFTDASYHNNGIDVDFIYENIEDPRLGRFRITKDSSDLGKYRTPSLRNLSFTSPYMHDGRMSTIHEVIEHYSRKVEDSDNVSAKLNPDNGGFQFNDQEKDDLLNFLLTLNDSTLLKNPAYILQ